MDHNQLADLIREHGALQMAEAVVAPIVPGIKHGWDLTRWNVTHASGAILFYRSDKPSSGEKFIAEPDRPVITDEPRILVLNCKPLPPEEEAQYREGCDAPLIVVYDDINAAKPTSSPKSTRSRKRKS